MTALPRGWSPALALTAMVGALGGAGCGEVIDASYVAKLSVAVMTPLEGPSDGGTRITVTGTRFCPDLQIAVDGIPATEVKVKSDRQAEAIMPPHARGDAVVTLSCGSRSVGGSETFRYVASEIELAVAEQDGGFRAFIDLDGDGWLDGFSAGPDGVEVHRGIAGGFGFDPTPFVSLAGATFDILLDGALLDVGHFAGDRARDVMVFDWIGADTTDYHLFTAESGFAEAGAGRIESAVDEVVLLSAVDLDGDGWRDLVVGEAASNGDQVAVSVLHGDGAGGFGAARALFSATAYLRDLFELFQQRLLHGQNGGLEPGDLDGDGIADLVLGWRGDRWVVVLGRHDRQYVGQQVPVEAGSGLIFFDTDAIPDRCSVQCATSGLTVRVWGGTGPGTFASTPAQFSVVSADWRAYCSDLAARSEPLDAWFLPRRFDLDADQHPEFLVESAGPSGWIELGPTTSEARDAITLDIPTWEHQFALVPGPGGSVRLVPREGDVQYLVPSPARRSIELLPLPPVGGQFGSDGCLGDFTGDAIPDLMVIRGGAAFLHAGTAQGRFEEQARSTFPVQGVNCGTAHFSDRGRADFFTALAAYRNQGDGTFVEWLADGADPEGGRIVDARDVDGDGLDDLVVWLARSAARYAGAQVGDHRVLRASGPGGFEPLGTAEKVPTHIPPVITDLNRDGWLDHVQCDQSTLVLRYGDAFQQGGTWGDATVLQLAGDCEWVALVEGGSGRFLLTSGGSVFLESEGWITVEGTRSDGQPVSRTVHSYEPKGAIAAPAGPIDGVAVCDLRGRGRKTDLVQVYDGSWSGVEGIGVAVETLGTPASFAAPKLWSSFGIAKPHLVGCGDVDGDGLDDVVVSHGWTNDRRVFVIRNVSR